MSGWIIAAALGSIAVTALLTLVLWRVNAPLLARAREQVDAGYVAPIIVAGGADDVSDGTSDSGSDGGGDGGVGGGGGK
jgi:hypothetical protein